MTKLGCHVLEAKILIRPTPVKGVDFENEVDSIRYKTLFQVPENTISTDDFLSYDHYHDQGQSLENIRHLLRDQFLVMDSNILRCAK